MNTGLASPRETLLNHTKAVLLDPSNIESLLACAQSLLLLNRAAEAFVYSERAFKLNPCALISFVHAEVLYQTGRYAQALALFEKNSDPQGNLNQRALCLTQLNRHKEAKELYERGLALNPNDPLLHTNYALCLLALGDFSQGFKAYEWRWQSQMKHRNRAWILPSHVSELRGKSLLICAEQGLGDSLQFFRYILLLIELHTKITLEIQPALITLLSYWKNSVTLLPKGSPLPICDYHFSMMSLPFIFKTELNNIPSQIPYVFSEPARTESCRQLLKKFPGKRVGIAWRGSVLNSLNHKRSIALKELLSLHNPGVHFICLQNDVNPEEKALLDQYSIPFYPSELNSFEGTAALISCLDLVVCIDTSIAHLAGAMGTPVWILLPFSSDWRWLLNREDSPWYPTARLLRQEHMDDWSSVLARAKNLLKDNE